MRLSTDRTVGMTDKPDPQLRLVIDPGVFISALISWPQAGQDTASQPVALIEAMYSGEFEAIASPDLLAELRAVLARDKFQRWFTAEEGADLVEILEQVSAPQAPDVEPDSHDLQCRDSKDVYLVTLTRHSEADFLVSGDSDLLEMDHPAVQVRSPRQIMEMINNS